ncbi:TPA: phage tail protein, partial [Yersinia enterocolitica]
TTFRIPDENGKSPGSVGAPVRRGDGAKSNGVTGTIQMDAARNITGSFAFSPSSGAVLDISTVGGAFVKGTTNKTAGLTTQAIGAKDLLFDASQSPGYLVADENRMLNSTGCWVIKLAGAAFNEGQINALELATEITLLSTRITTLEAHNQYIVLYPDGTQASPYVYPVNTRKEYANPFPGRAIGVEAQMLVNGIWGKTGWAYASSESAGTGLSASQINGTGNIIVQSGSYAASLRSNQSGNPHNTTATTPTAPFRLVVSTKD